MPRATTTALLAFTLAPGVEPFVSPKARSRPPLRLDAGPAELWSGYLAALEADPLPVKMATAACVIGAGDATAQLIENERKKLPDAARVARWAFFGLVLQAPWNHVWQNVLEGALPATASPWTAVTFEKVALDQGLQAPAFTALVFIFFAVLEGSGFRGGVAACEKDLGPTILKNWRVSCLKKIMYWVLISRKRNSDLISGSKTLPIFIRTGINYCRIQGSPFLKSVAKANH